MIAISCAHCGMKFEVKPEFAGHSTPCPTCNKILVVPHEATVDLPPPSHLDIGCGVSDLLPLKDMPLTWLRLRDCGQVRDLSPLKGLPLTALDLDNCGQVRDVSPLEDMPLCQIKLPPQVDQGMDAVRQIQTLGKINEGAADDFWKKYNTGKFPQYKP